MAKDVLIIPASGSIELKNDDNALKTTLQSEPITDTDKILTLPNKTGTLATTTDFLFQAEKTYTNVLITANDTPNGHLDFIKVIPIDTTSVWTLKYQFEVMPTVSTNTNYTGTFDCEVSGFGTAGNVYKMFNSFNGNATLIYYHTVTFAKTAYMLTDGHTVGIRLQSTSGSTTVARNYKVRIIDTKNCTATLLNTMTLNPYYQTVDAGLQAKYQSVWSLNGTSNGLQESGDADNQALISDHIMPLAGPIGMFTQSIVAENINGTFESLKTTDGISSSSVTLSPNLSVKFKLGKPLYLYTGATVANGIRANGWSMFTQYIFDVRYVSNYYLTSSGAAAFGQYNEAWIKVSVDLTDFTFSPLSVVIKKSDITTSGYYMRIGYSYSTSWSQATLVANAPIYVYNSADSMFTLLPLIRTASSTEDGLMSSTDKFRLDGMATNATANEGTVTSVTAGTQVSGLTMTITNGSTTPSIATSISNAANFRSAIGAGTGNGTVTSVTGTTNHISVATGTTTPVISLATAFGDTINPYASKTANYILAAPSGSAGVPSFRALTALDLGTTLTPTFGTITTGTAGQTWVIDGSTTSLLFQSGATPTTRLTLTNAGALTVTGAIVASNFSGSSSGTNTGDQTNISGTASNVTGIVAVANGGTGNTSVDTTPTASSTKMVTSGGVYTAFQSYTPTSRTINGLALSNNITLGGAEISPVATFSATGGETTTNLSDSHANKFWTVGSNGVNRTLYLSKAVSDTLAIGTEIHLMHNASTYTITISVEGTLTLQSLGSKVKLAGTYAVVTLKKIATTTWLLFGALA